MILSVCLCRRPTFALTCFATIASLAEKIKKIWGEFGRNLPRRMFLKKSGGIHWGDQSGENPGEKLGGNCVKN